MRAILLGKDGLYSEGECPSPQPAGGEAVVRVAYAGVNRADLLQKQGKYPLPAGGRPVPGMEFSGEIVACGPGTSRYRVGDKVCGLVAEGAFAEYAAIDENHLLSVAGSLTLEQAAALPEACFTVWISLVWQGRLKPGETALIHGGASGIGTVGIQIARQLGARVFATAGSTEKALLCERLGAERGIRYREEDFVEITRQMTDGKGVDVILDMVGGDYFERNLQTLAKGGRLAIIAFLNGANVKANLGPILLKHLQVTGSTLRSRPAVEKAQLAREVASALWPAVTQGSLKPVIDRVFPLLEAEKALERMDQGLNIGKILLKL